MRPVRRAFLQPPIKCLHVGHGGPLDFQIEITVEMSPDRDVGEREPISQHEGAIPKPSVEQFKVARTILDALLDGGDVPLRLGGPIEAPKNAD